MRSSALFANILLSQTFASATSIASWEGVRGVQIQDVFVLQGGYMQSGDFQDGSFKNVDPVADRLGFYYWIHLNQSFDATTQNAFDILGTNITIGTDTSRPQYIAGGIFQNNYTWYSFGGLLDRPYTGDTSVDAADVKPNVGVQSFTPSVHPTNNGNRELVNVNENITLGAYASSLDSTQKGWYFGGMVNINGTYISYGVSDTSSKHVTKASNAFYEVDMSNGKDAVFKNLQWPNGADPRAESGLVWLPYGQKGILVALGGGAVPSDAFNLPQKDTPNTYMTDLWIYDIAGAAWYSQTTFETGPNPNTLARFCTAVVPSADGHSFGVVVYGGYDTYYNSSASPVSDAVWMLSIPAFQWTKLTDGDTAHGRQGSVCIAPNPSTLITVGGTTKKSTALVSDSAIDVFNLNSRNWTGSYDPSDVTPFTASSDMVSQLQWPNGSGPGTSAVARGVSPSLKTILESRSTTLQPMYPYGNANSTTSNNSTGSGNGNSNLGHNHPNRWKIPVIAVLCSVIPLAIIALAVFCCIHNRRSKDQNVLSWLGKSHPKTEPSYTSDVPTVVGSQGDYFAQEAKGGFSEPAEVHADESHSLRPGWTSPGAFSQSTTTDGRNAPAEMYAHPSPDGETTRTSMSVRNHPFYPRSLSGDHIISGSTNRGSISQISGSSPQSPHARHELPNNRSHENVINKAVGTGGDFSPSSIGSDPVPPTSPSQTISRKPVADRPGHGRHFSGFSDASSLPSPDPEEDKRRSRALEGLPDVTNSPVAHGFPASPIKQQEK